MPVSRPTAFLVAAFLLAVAATACTTQPVAVAPSPAASETPAPPASVGPTAMPSPSPTPFATASPLPSPSPTPRVASFKADVAPLLGSKCAGCHMPGGAGSGDLEIFDDANAVVYAHVKGRLSTIVQEVRTGGMPRGRAPLTVAEQAVLTDWQKAGAPDN